VIIIFFPFFCPMIILVTTRHICIYIVLRTFPFLLSKTSMMMFSLLTYLVVVCDNLFVELFNVFSLLLVVIVLLHHLYL